MDVSEGYILSQLEVTNDPLAQKLFRRCLRREIRPLTAVWWLYLAEKEKVREQEREMEFSST